MGYVDIRRYNSSDLFSSVTLGLFSSHLVGPSVMVCHLLSPSLL